ncbi:hypothetical protein BKA82DRAFT_327872 [Pisolithus tinctorius]|uniref:Uncharacterized protein n=1 Tax=Pisolithus tinctorius Marx 270 TaxID=870435 RepID=A0A0C3P6D6_PISTI|nr:hypothetical protein BKA82DRAFT_327872 [Pisolithus tinctorius]KIO08840.1 hypothetical protein M404DRAFT_327872 [Pisolithus tinctorius Marx 270]
MDGYDTPRTEDWYYFYRVRINHNPIRWSHQSPSIEAYNQSSGRAEWKRAKKMGKGGHLPSLLLRSIVYLRVRVVTLCANDGSNCPSIPRVDINNRGYCNGPEAHTTRSHLRNNPVTSGAGYRNLRKPSLGLRLSLPHVGRWLVFGWNVARQLVSRNHSLQPLL